MNPAADSTSVQWNFGIATPPISPEKLPSWRTRSNRRKCIHFPVSALLQSESRVSANDTRVMEHCIPTPPESPTQKGIPWPEISRSHHRDSSPCQLQISSGYSNENYYFNLKQLSLSHEQERNIRSPRRCSSCQNGIIISQLDGASDASTTSIETGPTLTVDSINGNASSRSNPSHNAIVSLVASQRQRPSPSTYRPSSHTVNPNRRDNMSPSELVPSKEDCADQMDDVEEVSQRINELNNIVRSSLLNHRIKLSSRGTLPAFSRSPSQTPDRFIPSRFPLHELQDTFRVGRLPARLTRSEKTTRQQNSGPDPFSRYISRSTSLNEQLYSLPNPLSARATDEIPVSRRGGVQFGLISNSLARPFRHFSNGAIWTVGGSAANVNSLLGISDGNGGMLSSGTNAPLYTSNFFNRRDPNDELDIHERRLAVALGINQASRVIDATRQLNTSTPHRFNTSRVSSIHHHNDTKSSPRKNVWKDNEWVREGSVALLDAPHLRDDYYCSLLAYSHTTKRLAVGLGNFVHLWSETNGVHTPKALNTPISSVTPSHVTSLGFSSTQGGRSILAVGRANGCISLWCPEDEQPRFDAAQPRAISCISFRPTVARRESGRDPELMVEVEQLLVGDEAGHVYLYSVEWPDEQTRSLFDWHGAMVLLARMVIHTQQICGLAWSLEGDFFATGGNDNICHLFETRRVLPNHNPVLSRSVRFQLNPDGSYRQTVTPSDGSVLYISTGQEKHKWTLTAAVKAIAFCPWQRGLIAVGGGSNDRCIHFYHVHSGACLAKIYCAAQVTSLIWSTKRREIAATFGFAQPDHPYRIAVFSWPACKQLVAIPWADEHRALYAISYPGSSNTGNSREEDGVQRQRTDDEGCLVVAASDAAIRFHEIWQEDTLRKNHVEKMATRSPFGGSDILEALAGIEKEGLETIR